MKTRIAVMAVFCAVLGFAQAPGGSAGAASSVSLADARAQIDKAIESPDVMASLIKGLPEADQRQFLADVNKAIGELPGSVEEKTAKYLNANHAALKAAKGKGNLKALLAEVFATVSPEALTVLNERFAADLFNRAAQPGEQYTDERFTAIAVEAMQAIIERAEETSNGSTRSAFAILMFVRASNGSPADLADKLIDLLKHDDAKALARDEWIPSALGQDGREKGYEPLLASADAGRRPDFSYVLVIAGPQHLDAILADVVGKNTDPKTFIRAHTPVIDAATNPLRHQIPTLDGDVFGGEHGRPMDGRPPEDTWTYPGQSTY